MSPRLSVKPLIKQRCPRLALPSAPYASSTPGDLRKTTVVSPHEMKDRTR